MSYVFIIGKSMALVAVLWFVILAPYYVFTYFNMPAGMGVITSLFILLFSAAFYISENNL